MIAVNPPLPLTPRRRAALVQVLKGVVEYAVPTADFVVDGTPVGGWDRRTFADLRRVKMIEWSGDRGSVPVELTEQGRSALEEGKTPKRATPQAG